MPEARLSAVVHTYNSELFLSECLQSLSWCDEILVIDMHSTDQTRHIAQAYGARVLLYENVGYADPARQFGLENTRFNWVLSVDSDEIIPERLAQKIQLFLKSPDADVVHLCFRNFFFGRELKGSGWSYRNLHVPRLFKKGAIQYGAAVHAFTQINPSAKVEKWIDYDLAVIHFNYVSVEHFIEKLNRYTTLEARKQQSQSAIPSRFIYQFAREFFGRLFILRGYRDGWVGLYLAFAMAFYRWTSIAKAAVPEQQEIIQIYKNIARQTVALSAAKK